MSVERAPRLELETTRLSGLARSMAEVEWLLLILVVLYLFATNAARAQSAGVIATLVGFAIFVLVFRYLRPFARRASVKLALEIAAMLAFLTAVLAQAGGVASPLLSLYLLPIVTAALVLGKRATAVVMLAVAAAYPALAWMTGGGAWTTEFAVAAVGTLAPFVLVAVSTVLLAENIDTARQRIRALTERDELTDLYNMRAFKLLVGGEHDAAARAGLRYALLMVDIEHLKAVNDGYGHEAGNRAVRLVADALKRLTRGTDVVARYGGDEYIVFLANADGGVAREVAQRIRNVVFATTLEAEKARILRLKVNVGAATFPEDGHTLQAVMTAADRMMYKEKQGREPPKGRLIIQKR